MSLGLESLDLNLQESKIYIILLALGPLSLGEIIENAEFTLDDSIKSLEGLKKKGYIHEISGVATRYSALIPWNDLKTSTEKTLSQMEALAGQLDDYIAQKLGVILGTMREESQKIANGLKEAQSGVNQIEMKAEGDIEARVARFTLEVEQETDQTKGGILKTFESKSGDHQGLVTEIKEKIIQKNDEINTGFQSINQNILEGYQSGLNEVQNKEDERNTVLTTKVEELMSQSGESLTQGIQNVHTTMEKTGQSLYDSIDERNEKVVSHISTSTGGIAETITKISDNSQLKVVSAIGSVNDKIQEQLATTKQEATAAFGATGVEIKSKTDESAQNLQQTLNDTLIKAQNQLTEMLQNAQETLSQTVSDTRTQVETTIKEFSDSVKLNTDSDVQKIVINTESTLGGLAQDSQVTFDKSKEEISTVLSEMKTETSQKTNESKEIALMELESIIKTLKAEVSSQLEGFKSTMEPQQNFLKEKLASFQSEFSSSQTQSINTFKDFMEEFKAAINAKHQELSDLINKEKESVIENVNTFIEGMKGQIQDYDNEFRETLTQSAITSSEKVILKTREFQEKMVAVVNEMSKSANDQLTATTELISSSIETEISTLETELSDYASKFKELTLSNEEIFKNHLFSLEKLSSLVTDTKHPIVQTAPIISKEATINYIRSMFSRMKAGITILMPNIDDIPVDLILASKTTQKINIVSIVDINTHKDFLKNVFQKPNVKVKSVDPQKFVGVEGYLAADRDGEEVIIGIKEDQGGVVSIASESDAFISLMGKIVLGDYFLARSREIQRIDVGM